MTQELFYTSAPRGLQPGSTGFCTVAETRGLSSLLRERLEDLSGYRELFPPHDSRASQNPVAWSHSRFTIQGKTLSVLSRVGAAGVDHSQRTNKFAHHVVVDASEQNLAGPAALLARPGFMDTVWDGKVRTLPTGRPVPAFDVRPAPCAAWQRVTGDAGWAGALVDAYLNNRPAYLLYPVGLDPLPLLVEALALLPPDRRWQTTFSTYFTVLPSGSPCAWRCVPLESPGAAEALRVPAALVIRLDTSQGSAPAGVATDAARTGQTITAGPAGPQPVGAVPGGRVPPPPRDPVTRPAAAAVTQTPKQEVAESYPAPNDANSYPETVQLAPIPARASLVGGFPAGLAVGLVGAALLGLGLWLGVGWRVTDTPPPPPAVTGEGREAEIARKVEEAHKQWEEKELRPAIERGRKDKEEELRKEVLVARNCREVLPTLLGEFDTAALEDKAAMKKTLTARLDEVKVAQADRKTATNARDLLPLIFPTFDISTLADSGKFKMELARVQKKIRDDAVKDKAAEQSASLNKALAVLKFYFGFDDAAVRESTPEQLKENAQTRYVELLKKEGRIDTELENAVKARDSYKRYLAARMDDWRAAVKSKVRSEKDVQKEAEETRLRVALEMRPEKNDPLLLRTKTFEFITTWIMDYFDTVEHCDFVLKNSRRDDKRERAKALKKEVTDLRQSAIDELDRYLKSAK